MESQLGQVLINSTSTLFNYSLLLITIIFYLTIIPLKIRKINIKITLICRSTIYVKNRISCIIKIANKLTRKELSFEDITEYNINKEVKYYTEKSTEFAIECIIEI